MVHRWIVATLPLDDERRAEARIWLEFAARAVSHHPFAQVHAETDRAVRRGLSDYLERSRDQGEVPATINCAAAAHALVAVADGLAVQLLYSFDPTAGATVAGLLDTPTR